MRPTRSQKPKQPVVRKETLSSRPWLNPTPDVASRSTWLAVSLGGDDVALTTRIRKIQPWVDAVEFRLDLLPPSEVNTALEASPLPVIITYRPQREGGSYTGAENTRLSVLRHTATYYPVAAVDIEWDAVDNLGAVPVPRIVSRHFFRHTPMDLYTHWRFLAGLGGEIIKVATYAHTLTDALRVTALYKMADRPTIAIAMGKAGLLTRVIAPFFPTAYLTYGAEKRNNTVAPGQLAIQIMREVYHVHRLGPDTELVGYLAPEADKAKHLGRLNAYWARHGYNRVILPLAPTLRDDLSEIVARAWELGFKRLWVTKELLEPLGLHPRHDVWLYPDYAVEKVDESIMNESQGGVS